MKPHPRIRKTIKWGGAAVTVLLVVVWVQSYQSPGPLLVHFTTRHIGAIVEAGELRVNCWSEAWFRTGGASGYYPIAIPVWLPVSAAAIATALIWRLDSAARRRARLNLCPKCNYDRAGLAAGAVCPECGEPSA